jgi:hypothetical protein
VAEAPLEHVVQVGDLAALSISGFDEANEAKIALLFQRGSKSEKTKINGAVQLSVTQAFSSAKTRKSRNYPSWLAERSANVYRSFTVCAIPIRVSRLLPCMGLARMKRARKSRARVLALRGGGKKGPGLC